MNLPMTKIGQPIRMVLTYVGVEFEDIRYEVSDGPEYSKRSFLDIKDTLGLDFPNLPYYIDGDTRLSQSNTILKHLGRKHNLAGQTDHEKDMVDLMLDQAMDFRNALIFLCYYDKENFKKNWEVYFKTVSDRYFKSFSKKLGENPWFTGDKITVCDFHMYELLYQHRIMEPDCLNDFPNFLAFLDRFEALPSIKAYMESDKYLKTPINNKMANCLSV